MNLGDITLGDLPYDIIYNITSYLDLISLLKLSQMNRVFFSIISELKLVGELRNHSHYDKLCDPNGTRKIISVEKLLCFICSGNNSITNLINNFFNHYTISEKAHLTCTEFCLETGNRSAICLLLERYLPKNYLDLVKLRMWDTLNNASFKWLVDEVVHLQKTELDNSRYTLLGNNQIPLTYTYDTINSTSNPVALNMKGAINEIYLCLTLNGLLDFIKWNKIFYKLIKTISIDLYGMEVVHFSGEEAKFADLVKENTDKLQVFYKDNKTYIYYPIDILNIFGKISENERAKCPDSTNCIMCTDLQTKLCYGISMCYLWKIGLMIKVKLTGIDILFNRYVKNAKVPQLNSCDDLQIRTSLVVKHVIPTSDCSQHIQEYARPICYCFNNIVKHQFIETLFLNSHNHKNTLTFPGCHAIHGKGTVRGIVFCLVGLNKEMYQSLNTQFYLNILTNNKAYRSDKISKITHLKNKILLYYPLEKNTCLSIETTSYYLTINYDYAIESSIITHSYVMMSKHYIGTNGILRIID